MSKNKILLAALGGAIGAALLANYLGTEKGKKLLSSSSGILKDLADRAIEYAKNRTNVMASEE